MAKTWFGALGFILGIISLILFIITLLGIGRMPAFISGIILSIIGIILSRVQNKKLKTKLSYWGMTLNVAALVLFVILIIFLIWWLPKAFAQ